MHLVILFFHFNKKGKDDDIGTVSTCLAEMTSTTNHATYVYNGTGSGDVQTNLGLFGKLY